MFHLSEGTNLGLALFLDQWDNLFGWLFGDVFLIPQPGDFGIWRPGNVGIDADFFALLNANTRLHTSMQSNLWFI